MNLTQIENIADTNGVLRQLRDEAKAAILDDLTTVVFHHEAQTLAGDVKAMLVDARKEAKALESM